MHPLTTNRTAPTRDVHRFGFESAGALEIVNEYSGLGVDIWMASGIRLKLGLGSPFPHPTVLKQ